MADKQLIIVVEGTSAMGPYWKTIVSDYLENIIRSFCANDTTVQKSSTAAASGSTFELALVMFNTHGPYSGSLVQRSGWTRDIDNFLGWLSSISFSGGGWSDVATAEGLAEALMMFAIPQNGFQTQQNFDGKRHCVLVSASNPYPLPTPVYRPAMEILDQAENGEAHTENVLFDSDTVSKWFGQCSVSLSVICPKQLPKLRALYNAAKRSQRTSEPVVDVKQPHFLVLLSDGFIEACAALSRSGVPPSQNPVSALPPGSGPPVSSPSANGSTLNRPPISTGNIAQATVKVEPSTVTSIGSGPAHPHMPSMPRAAAPSVPSLQASSPPTVSQETTSNNESLSDMKPMVSLSQNTKPVGARALLNNISNIRGAALSGITSLGLPSISGNPIGTHMSNVISSGMASTGSPQTVLSSGQSDVPAVSGSGTITGPSQPVQNTAINSFSTSNSNVSNNSNLGISQSATNPLVNVNNTMGSTVSGIGQGSVPLIAQSGNNMNPNTMSALGTNGGSSGTGSMMLAPGMPQQAQGMQSVGMNNSVSNMSMSQQGPSSLPSSQSKYVKVWEGNLSGQRQQQPVFITKLEGYRNATASETLAANWPPTMQIVRLISQDHMNNKQYVGKADFLVFRAMNQHGFLSQLQEKKLCAVIQLPSQTLLLSVSDKACRLIGMLFPGDMVVFKPQIPSQQQQQQLQHQQLQQQQQHPQLQQQQLQHLQQQQTMQQLQQLQQQPTMQLQQQQQHIPQLQQQISQLQQLQQQQQQQQIPQLQQQQLQQLQQQQQQQIPQLQQQLQQQQQQQQQQLQQLQQQSQSQQMAGGVMGQGYMQGPSRPQLVPQGQVPSQGTPPNMAGGGFMG